jgi:hypothetical protein
MTLHELGKRAGVELDLMARTTEGETITEAMEKRRMTIAVSRYLKQAQHLIGACKLFCVNTDGSVIGDRGAGHQIQS